MSNSTNAETFTLHESSINASWLVLSASLVFIMQIGFMALETGSVGRVWKPGTIVKNFEDLFLGVVSFSILGYSFAFADDGIEGFIGGFKYAFLRNIQPSEYLFVLFQMCFVSTAATIVSGCVVERMTSGSYAMFSFLLSLIVYPVLVHWVWSSGGWLLERGFVDFAGSGVVHVTGGLAGLVLLQFLGDRVGKNSGIKGLDHNEAELFIVGTGVFLLWIGWIGFNCGSVIYMVGDGTPELVGLIALNVILSAAVSAATSNVYLRFVQSSENFDITESLNCLLAGLVCITSSCHQIAPWAASVIGVEATIAYFLWEKLLKKLNIDDPLSVTSVHLMGGAVGVLNQGLFADTGDAETSGVLMYGNFKQFGVQLLGLICIFVWVTIWVCVLAKLLDFTMGIRASLFVEDQGVKLWEYAPNLAFKMLFPSIKQDPAARLWLWSFHNFVFQVYNHDLQALDAIVAIDEFKRQCQQALIDNFSRNGEGEYDFTELKKIIHPMIQAIHIKYIKDRNWKSSLEKTFADDLQDIYFNDNNNNNNNDDLNENMENMEEQTQSPLLLKATKSIQNDLMNRQMTGIESAGNDMMNYFRQETLDTNDMQRLLEMRYMTIFDSIREEATKQLLNAWNIFAKQGVSQQFINMKPDKIFIINSDEGDFSINWLSEIELRNDLRQKSIYERASRLVSPKSVDIPKEE